MALLVELQNCIEKHLTYQDVLKSIKQKPNYNSWSEDGRLARFALPTAEDGSMKDPMQDGALGFVGWILAQGNSPRVLGIRWDQEGHSHLYQGHLVDRN